MHYGLRPLAESAPSTMVEEGQGSRAECSVVRCISKDGRAVFNIAGNKYRIVVWIKRPPTMAMAWKLHKGLGIPAESLIKQAA
jgi:hypothetical protein